MYQNERATQPPEENTVIAYAYGKAIMIKKDFPGKFFYDEIAYPYVTIGEHLVEAQPKPIELLPDNELCEIYEVLKSLERM